MLKMRGEYSSSTSYAVDDLVLVSSSQIVYRCVKAGKGLPYGSTENFIPLSDPLREATIVVNELKKDVDNIVKLPAVKNTDNGKVLTVVDGKWAAADLPQPETEPETEPQPEAEPQPE